MKYYNSMTKGAINEQDSRSRELLNERQRATQRATASHLMNDEKTRE